MSDSDSGKRGAWSAEEHERFLAAVEMYPQGPWKEVARHIGTRSVRQVQTHAQRHQEKAARRLRAMRKGHKAAPRSEHHLVEQQQQLQEVLGSDPILVARASAMAMANATALEMPPHLLEEASDVSHETADDQEMRDDDAMEAAAASLLDSFIDNEFLCWAPGQEDES